MADICTLF